MKRALDQFDENLSRARALSSLATSLVGMITSAVDLSDMHRASLVLSVSALDQFVHDFVRIGMLEVQQGVRPATQANHCFRVPLQSARLGIADPTTCDWLDAAVREAHSWLSFQHPDKVADAIRLVSNVKLWEEVGKKLASEPRTVKVRLIAIVDRRNKIAHEADMDPTNPGTRWAIDPVMVGDAMDFLDSVAHAIYDVCA